MHYDLFADRQIDFFSQALDWTYKYKKQFSGGTELEFKGHIGWTVFNADTFYIHNKYSGIRRTKNNYGTGVNMKLIFSVQNPQWGDFELKAFIYEAFNIFWNENKDSGGDLCMKCLTYSKAKTKTRVVIFVCSLPLTIFFPLENKCP
jgi:hypothetical protein